MGGGTTVLFVSHSIDQIREMCNRVIWLEKGEVKMEGETKMVCDAYQKYINPVADDGDKKHKASDAPKFFSDVLFIYGEDEDAYDWRVTNIREQLQTGQMNSNEVYYENLSQDLVKKYRIFIFVGCSEEEGIIDFIKLAKKLNKTVIVDINKCNSDVIYFKHQNELLENVREYCDGVMVSNEYLQETYNAIGYTTILNELVTSERIAEYAAWSIYDRDVLHSLTYFRTIEQLEQKKIIKYHDLYQYINTLSNHINFILVPYYEINQHSINTIKNLIKQQDIKIILTIPENTLSSHEILNIISSISHHGIETYDVITINNSILKPHLFQYNATSYLELNHQKILYKKQ